MTYWKTLSPAFIALSLLISAPVAAMAEPAATKNEAPSLPLPSDLLKILPTDHVQGKKDAKVLVIEYV